MEMREQVVPYRHFNKGERVRHLAKGFGKGTVIKTDPPTIRTSATVYVKLDDSCSLTLPYYPDELEVVVEPITNDERLNALLKIGYFHKEQKGPGRVCVIANGSVVFYGNTDEQAIDEFVMWYRKQPEFMENK